MPSQVAIKISQLLTDCNVFRVTFGISQPQQDIPSRWIVGERRATLTRSAPVMIIPQKKVAGLSMVLTSRRFNLDRVYVTAEYEDGHVLRKPRMTFFWKKGFCPPVHLEHTPDALTHMDVLSKKRPYNIELFVDEDKTIGIYCKPY